MPTISLPVRLILALCCLMTLSRPDAARAQYNSGGYARYQPVIAPVHYAFGDRPALPPLPAPPPGEPPFGHRPALPPISPAAVAPAPQPVFFPAANRAPVRLASAISRESHQLARMGLTYRFGSMDPSSGGLDCSGSVKYVLERVGVPRVPRTASEQYAWLAKAGTLTPLNRGANPDWIVAHLKPGDLLFWRGTYVTNRWPDVSHVMIYLGRHPQTGRPMMFGARSSSGSLRGINGNAVDIFEFQPVSRGKSEFIGFGSIPG